MSRTTPLRPPRPVRPALVAAALALVAACSSSTDVDSRRADAAGDRPSAPAADAGDPAEPAGADPGEDPGTDEPADDPGPGDPGSVDGSDERGTLEWERCPNLGQLVQFDCATLTVPLDYDDPDGAQIDIEVARAPATGGDPIGALVFNPGGPGGSGLEFLVQADFLVSTEIAARFDLVSFDPRGVGASTAFDCDLELDDEILLVDAGDRDGWGAVVDQNADWLTACADDLDLMPHLGTVNAARDLDRLREALGDEQLTYVGFSYGTRLGAAYAELFPDNVRALVLDGAVKPVTNFSDFGSEQGRGFDRAYANLVEACDADPDCPTADLGPADEVIDALRADVAEQGPLGTQTDRVLTAGELDLAIVAALYSKASWQFVMEGVRDAVLDGDGSLLQVLADRYLGRELDGSYTNQTEANTAINCADDLERPTVEEAWEEADSIASEIESFDELLRAGAGCLDWPATEQPLQLGPADGAAPILVIGTTGDPATPYEWAVELTDFLDSGVLYTVDGEGHTAYLSIDCVTPVVEAYLVDLRVPAPDESACADAGDDDLFPPVGSGEIDVLLALLDCLRDNGVDIPALTAADVLADPTGEQLVEYIDPADPAFLEASTSCLAELEAAAALGS